MAVCTCQISPCIVLTHADPLRTGLAVKPAGAPMYSAGKDGDLRDIWRRVIGEIPLERGATSSGSATIMTVYGTESISEHKLDGISKEIAIIGNHLKEHGAKRVAIYQPNSIEFLASLFAGAFYGFTPILIPYNQPHPTLVELLIQTGADALIAEAGSLPLADLIKGGSGVRQIIWTVETSSRHMGWSEVPEGIGGKIDISVWHELVQDQHSGTIALPTTNEKAPTVVFLWQEAVGKPAEIVEFTQQNLAAAVGSLITALPAAHRFNSSDTFLSADAFTHSYSLCLTLAALFSHSTVIINSVAGPGVDLTLATRAIAPTIVVVSAETAAKLHSTTATTVTTAPKKFAHQIESRMLTAGRLPTDTLLSRLNAPSRASIGTTPGKLRLVFVSERAGLNTPPLSSDDLSDLRIYTKARVVYALTAAKVAGAIAQTNVYDYRRGLAPSSKHSHFGAPLSSLEIKLKDTQQHKTTDEQSAGELVVTGSSVAGGEALIGVNGECLQCFLLKIVLTVYSNLPGRPYSSLCVNYRSISCHDLFCYFYGPCAFSILSMLSLIRVHCMSALISQLHAHEALVQRIKRMSSLYLRFPTLLAHHLLLPPRPSLDRQILPLAIHVPTHDKV
jgi:acyl-CoA synthetase (AMP-forming)/AMP-acid ligase II